MLLAGESCGTATEIIRFNLRLNDNEGWKFGAYGDRRNGGASSCDCKGGVVSVGASWIVHET